MYIESSPSICTRHKLQDDQLDILNESVELSDRFSCLILTLDWLYFPIRDSSDDRRYSETV